MEKRIEVLSRSATLGDTPGEPEARQKILIVDDSPVNIHALSAMLSTEHDIIFATRGEEALEIATRQRPDLVLLDVVMPDLDGYEVLRRLKRDSVTAGIPVIFITAKGDVEDEAKGLQMGAIDYIVKPFSPGIVRVRVNNHLELKRHRDLLRSLSNLDGLTGIANRRCFDDYLRREWQRALRGKTPLGLVMIDIDHFKSFNDRYGHGEGDDCLCRVAATLCAVPRRPADLVARYGGEEFVAVLPDTPFDGVAKLAAEMLEAVRGLGIPHAGNDGGVVTCSLGAAAVAVPAGHVAGDLLKAADDALYRAKNEGRARVALAPSLE